MIKIIFQDSYLIFMSELREIPSSSSVLSLSFNILIYGVGAVTNSYLISSSLLRISKPTLSGS
jgi:hypothetical protein